MIKLTNREKTICDKLMLGFTSYEIAEIFNLHQKYVTKIMQRIYVKKGVNSRHGLLALRICYLENLLHQHGVDYDTDTTTA